MAQQGESIYLFGMYDRGAEAIMTEAGRKGWILVSEAIGHHPDNMSGASYRGLADEDFGVIVELNNGSGTDGTLPLSQFYGDFASRCGNFVGESSGCHIWVIGNEPNAGTERPERGSPQEEVITPQLYARCYKECRSAIRSQPDHKDDMVLIAAVAPHKKETTYPGNRRGDWVRYLQDVMLLLGPGDYDGIAVHVVTLGNTPDLITHDLKMEPPFSDRHLDFKSYQDVMGVIPSKVPVFITKTNPQSSPDGASSGWTNGSAPSEWVQAAYREIYRWNQSHADRQIRCLILYRWGPDAADASVGDIQKRPGVVQDFRHALVNDYRWTVPAQPEYRAAFLTQNTPATFVAGDTMEVLFRLRNDGTATWDHGGAHPFRLCSAWLTANNREVSTAVEYHNDLPTDVRPGSEVKLVARTMTPDTPGHHRLCWEMVQEGVTRFTDEGDRGQTILVKVLPAELPHKPPVENVISQLPRHPTLRYTIRERGAVSAIIIHHSVVPPTVDAQRIARYHVEKSGWPGIGYHFFVGADGYIRQTQALEAISYHAGDMGNRVGVGVCLSGDFTNQAPSDLQLTATAQLVAWLLNDLDLSLDAVHGHSDYRDTQCPGLTWPTTWRDHLLEAIRRIVDEARPVESPQKVMEHYLLFWQTPTNWAREEWRSAENYVGKFRVTMGFSADDAMHARRVTIVGNSSGVSADVESHLLAGGCQVERVPGQTPAQIKVVLDEMAVRGRPFLTLT